MQAQSWIKRPIALARPYIPSSADMLLSCVPAGPSDQLAVESAPQAELREPHAQSAAASSVIELLLHNAFGAKRPCGLLFDDTGDDLGSCRAEARTAYWLARLFQKRWADVTALASLPVVPSGGRRGDPVAVDTNGSCGPDFAARCMGAFAQLHLQQWDVSYATAIAAIERSRRAFTPRCEPPRNAPALGAHAVMP